MGYHVKKVCHKNYKPNWKIQYISYKKEDAIDLTVRTPRKTWDIPKTEWQSLGFHPWMSFEEASSRKKQLNANRKKIQERNKFHINLREKVLAQQTNNYCFPALFKEGFEKRFLWGRGAVRYRSKIDSQWRAAQKCILEVQKEPYTWFEEYHSFYDYFYSQALSLSYIRKILYLINLWGFYISRKLGQPFLPIPSPRGYEKTRLLKAYYRKIQGRKIDSDPITFAQLKAVSEELNISN